LLIRRALGAEPGLKFYVSNAGAETPVSTLALVACTRCRVEEFLEDCKSYLGMAQYETRSWAGWHHHMTLVGLAHLFVTLQGNGILSHVLNKTFSRYSSLKAHFSRLVSIPRRHSVSRFSNPRANRRITLRFAAA
jgi:SRSO17 transposase